MAEARDPRLLRLIEREELIDAEMANLREERKAIRAEAKLMGYHMATYRKLLARRKMSPAERGEADAMLEEYEAALGMEADFIPARRADAAELAALLLHDQVEGLKDPERAELLVGHVQAILELMDEIDEIRAMANARRKAADADGFPAAAIRMVTSWYRKVARHGLAEMRLGEELFRSYRATVEEAGGPQRPSGEAPTADEKLAALFAKPPKAPTAKQRAVSDAVALAAINSRSSGIGRGRTGR